MLKYAGMWYHDIHTLLSCGVEKKFSIYVCLCVCEEKEADRGREREREERRKEWSKGVWDMLPQNMWLCHTDCFKLKGPENSRCKRASDLPFFLKATDETLMQRTPSSHQGDRNILIIRDRELRLGEMYTNRLC